MFPACSHWKIFWVTDVRRSLNFLSLHTYLFSTLSGLVEFDGFYLESDPCLVCNNPEVPFSVSDVHDMSHLNAYFSCCRSKCWPNLFPVLLEHQTLIYQSGHPLHYHSASGEVDWQPHYQQSHREDWRSQENQDGSDDQPLLQQQDRTGNRRAEEQVSIQIRILKKNSVFLDGG